MYINNMKHAVANYQFNGRERCYNSLGLIILAVVGVVALIDYGLGYLFSGKPWQIVSPGLHAISAITGIILVWLGSGKPIKHQARLIDQSLDKHLSYRIFRWCMRILLSLLGLVATIIFFAWTNASPPSRRHGVCDQREKTSDDIWDSNNYYDNEPPPPFS